MTDADRSRPLLALRRLRDRVVAWRHAGLLDEETLPAIDAALAAVAPETSARLIALRPQIGAAMETIHGIAGDGSQDVVTESERQLLGAWAELQRVQLLIGEWLAEGDDDV